MICSLVNVWETANRELPESVLVWDKQYFAVESYSGEVTHHDIGIRGQREF
jgi:hypothetical protein